MKPVFVFSLCALLASEQYVVADNLKLMFADNQKQQHNDNLQAKEIFRIQTTKENVSSGDKLISHKNPIFYSNMSRPLLSWLKEHLVGVETDFSSTQIRNNGQLSSSATPTGAEPILIEKLLEELSLSNENKPKTVTSSETFTDKKYSNEEQSVSSRIYKKSEPIYSNENQLNNEQSVSSRIYKKSEPIYSNKDQLNNEPSVSSRIYKKSEPIYSNEDQLNNERSLSSDIFEGSTLFPSSKKQSNGRRPFPIDIFTDKEQSSSNKNQPNFDQLFSKEILLFQTTKENTSSDDRLKRHNKSLSYPNMSGALLSWIKENLIGVETDFNGTHIQNNGLSPSSTIPTSGEPMFNGKLSGELSLYNENKSKNVPSSKIFTYIKLSSSNVEHSNNGQSISGIKYTKRLSYTNMSVDFLSFLKDILIGVDSVLNSGQIPNNDQSFTTELFTLNDNSSDNKLSNDYFEVSDQLLSSFIIADNELSTSNKPRSNYTQNLSSDTSEDSELHDESNNDQTPSTLNQQFTELGERAQPVVSPGEPLAKEYPPRNKIAFLNFTKVFKPDEGLGCNQISFLINLNRTNSWKAIPDAQIIPYPKVGYSWLKESINMEAPPEECVDCKLPSSFDSRKVYQTCSSLREPLDQGCNCQASWAVSSASAFSDRLCIHSGGEINIQLSAQQVLSCSDGNGCEGGHSLNAWMYFQDNGIVSGSQNGQPRQGCQPYQIKPCAENTEQENESLPLCSVGCQPSYHEKNMNPINYKASRVYCLIETTVDAIKREIFFRGPVTAEIKIFEDYQCYNSGIYSHVIGEYLGYTAVKVIGWGEEEDIPYWLIANTWGTEWGEQGFSRVRMEANGLNIESYISAGIPILNVELKEIF